MNSTENPILKTDSYKLTHWNQYPRYTEFVQMYFAARKVSSLNPVVFFGLQPLLIELCNERISKYDVEQARDICAEHFGRPDVFNYNGFMHIVNKHNGVWPIQVYSIPEGTLVTEHKALFVVENNCPECYWVPSFLETRFDQVWAPCTVATKSFFVREMIQSYMALDGSNLDELDFKLHDFGVRGVTSIESAGWSGMGHLLSFNGTDNVPAIMAARKYYRSGSVGLSVPATEHSVATSFGPDYEMSYIDHVIQRNLGHMVSVVGDSYDIFNFAKKVLDFKLTLKSTGTTLVLRPDSGDPITVVPEVIKILMQAGHTLTEHGYKVLPPYFRVIQGDGMSIGAIHGTIRAMHKDKLAIDNIVFGMGGGLLQDMTRDDYGFTMKACQVTVGGKTTAIYKMSTDKKSLQGNQLSSDMDLVFDAGWGFANMPNIQTFEQVREILSSQKI